MSKFVSFGKSLPKKTLLLAALLPSAFVCVPADAAVQHPDVSVLTYTDFGQNRGRYQAGAVNALLADIRAREGGVVITYTGGQASYTLPHGMIDFGSQADNGASAAIGYNFLATVAHNDVQNPTYTARVIGSDDAIKYYGIEYRYSANNTFRHVIDGKNDNGVDSDYDYKITRQSKIVTDVVTSQVYTGAGTDLDDALIYRAGSGTMVQFDAAYQRHEVAGPYVYITGGLMTMEYVNRLENDFPEVNDPNADPMSLMVDAYMTPAGISAAAPLPWGSKGGDSGSPCWVYNEATGTFQYVAATQSSYDKGTGAFSQARGAPAWSNAVMASYDKVVDLSKLTDSASSSTVYVNAVNAQSDETISDSTNDGVSTNYWFGDVTDTGGNALTTFRGVQTGVNTWKDLSPVMDSDTWYAYDNTYLNASSTKTEGKDLIYADLYDTDNLVFKAAAGTETVDVVLSATVDTGIGYTQFSKADGAASAIFNVSAANGADYLLNTAGFVVDAGVSVTLNLNVSQSYVREWRKVGEGELRIAGSGDNYALLNLGGAGTTYLERENGFAAYNVLANTGTTVVINDVNQIARDFTFGNDGATLDFNGNSMTWNNAAEVSAEGFHIRALTEDAIITNTKAGTTTTLTVTDGGASFLGSFVDTAAGALKIVYDGGANASWTLNSIFTNLKNNEGSGFTVRSGSVTLAGTNTVHAEGSATGTNADRYTNADDWHYADMKADVAVESGATFTLGSHARLTGDVAVADGGTFVMKEGVKHRYEYIEGGYVLEDTNEISAFFGLKGDVALNGGNANLKIEYSAGTTAAQTYAGNITGDGNVSVALGTDGATLTLSGQNTFAGTKTLTSGGLIASSAAALGDVATNKWKIESAGWLAVGGDSALTSEQLLGYIDGNSTGVLALTGDRTEQINVSASHAGLIIGAAEGKTVQYGAAGTTETLNAVGGKWTLGGGGGELVVNFKLSGTNDLVLGNEYGKGAVTLTNAGNDFTGTISFVGGVTLNATSGDAFGGANIALSYTNRATLTGTGALSKVPQETADGVLLLDRWADETLDLSGHAAIALGADGDVSFDAGKITVATDGDYRFGGTTGTLTLTGTLAAAGTQNGLVVDAQTYSGGKIVLESAQTNVTGTVSVMGYDSSKSTSTDGEITLSFSAGNDDALASAAGTTVSDGGVIDLAGTTQTFQNLSVAAGGTVTDSAGTGTLVVSTAGTIAGTVEVGTLEETGAGTTLTVDAAGAVSANAIKISAGGAATFSGTVAANTITISGAGAEATLSGTVDAGTIAVESSGVLNVYGDKSVTAGFLKIDGAVAHVKAENALNDVVNVSVESGKTGTLSVDVKATVSSALNVAEAGTLNIVNGAASSEKVDFSGAVSAEKGTLSKSGAGTVVFKNNSFKAANIVVGEGTLQIHNKDDAKPHEKIISRVELAAGTTLSQFSADVPSSKTTIGELALAGANATLQETNHGGYWLVGKLSLNKGVSSATLTLDANHSSDYFSVFELGKTDVADAGNFAGTLALSQTDSTDKHRGSAIVLSNATIAQNAVVSLTQKVETAVLAVGVNADATIAGLNGGAANSALFSGTLNVGQRQVDASGTTTNAFQTSWIQNGAARTLTIAAADGANYDFAGNVVADASGNALSIVKTGAGTQSFSGESIALGDVSALGGTLTFSGTTTVGGNVAVASGATLTLGDSFVYSLSAGKTFSVLGAETETTGTGATFSSPLLLNGGELVFAGTALQSESVAALSLGGIQFSDTLATQTVSFTDANRIDAGTYLLSDQDWSKISADKIVSDSASGLADYLTMSFSTGTDGLKVTFAMKDGTRVWRGTESAKSWTASAFGVDAFNAASAASDTFYFNERGHGEVVVGESVSVGKIIVQGEQDYAFTSTDGATLTAGTLSVESSATTTLGAAISATTIEKTNAAGTLVFDGAGVVSADELKLSGGATASAANADAFSGLKKISVAAGETGTLTTSVGNTKLAAIEVAETGTLTLLESVTGKHFNLTGENMNAAGGVIEMRAGTLNLSGETALTLGGTLKVSENSPDGVLLFSNYSADNVSRTFAHVDVAAGKTLTLDEASFNTIWTLHEISGAGTVQWNSDTEHNLSSRVVLDGANTDFTGTFVFVRELNASTSKTDGSSWHGNTHEAFVEIKNDSALVNAVLDVRKSENGTATNAYCASVALDTDDAHMKGLVGTAGTLVFAGAAPTDAQKTAPSSTRTATLTIDADAGKEYTFAGDVAGDSANGVSLVKTGAGAQNFTGDSLAFRDVAANAGTLSLNAADGGSLAIYGNVSVASGATLELSGLSGKNAFTIDSAGTVSVGDMSAFTGHITKTGAGKITVATKSDSAAWTIVGDAFEKSFNFNDFAGDGATVTLRGAGAEKAYFAKGSFTFSQNLVLTADADNGRDYGLTINDGYSNSTYTFTGSVSGDGKFVVKTKISDRFIFAGDLSGFSGGFEINANRTIEFSDNGGTTTYAGTDVAGAGTISADGTVVFNYAADHAIANAISGNGVLEKNGAGTLTASGAISLKTVNVNAGTLALAETAALSAPKLNVAEAGTLAVVNGSSSEALELSSAIAAAGTLRKSGAGTVVLANDSLSAADVVVEAGTLQIKNSSATAGSAKTLTRVELADGTTLSQYAGATASAATAIGELALGGTSATLQAKNFAGAWQIDKLSQSDETASATLTLDANHDAMNFTVFELGKTDAADAGNFAGTIALEQTHTGNYRGTALVLSNAGIARNAVVSLSESQSSSSAILAVGVNADATIIAGLNGGTANSALFSGTIGAGESQKDNSSFQTSWIQNGAARTLTIDAAKGASHDFKGTVVADASGNALSLVKDGAGTQSFTGNEMTFGAVSANAGTLSLNAADGGSLAIRGNVSVASDAALELFGLSGENTLAIDVAKTGSAYADAMSAFTGSVAKTGAGTLTLAGDNVYAGGTTISAGTLVAKSASAMGKGAVKIEGGQLQIASGVTLAQTNVTIVLTAANRATDGTDARTAAAIVGESAAATATVSRLATRSATTGAALADGTTVTIALSAEQQSEIAGLTAGSAISYYLWDTGTVSVGANTALNYSFVGDDGFASNLSTAYDASSGMLTISAVPEPSAFGLLAGTLALALASSARRKGKKA